MNAIEHLAERAWKRPDNYAGFNPEGDLLVLSRNRDSSLLEESNWDVACESLKAEEHDGDYKSRPTVYTFRASHWAVGWVEYLMVRNNAPWEVQESAGEIVCSLADYPVLSDDDYSERCWTAAQEAWANASIRDRVEWIKRCSVRAGIFAARRDSMPECDDDSLQRALIGE